MAQLQPKGIVSDYEQLFSPIELATLDSAIRAYNEQHHVEIAVVTLRETDVHEEDFDEYTLSLANNWGIGKQGLNNGILIAISKSMRKVRVQNGKGITAFMSNAATKEILDNDMIPYLKQKNSYQAILSYCQALSRVLPEYRFGLSATQQLTNSMLPLIKMLDTDELKKVTADSIYCPVCSDIASLENPMVSKDVFYDRYFNSLFVPDLIHRLERKEYIIVPSESTNESYLVLFSIFRNNELADGHEGAQLEFAFSLTDGKLLLTGLSSIP